MEGTDVIRHRVMPTGFGPLALPLLQNLPFYRGYLLYRGKQPMNGRNTFVTKKTRIAEVCGYIKAKKYYRRGNEIIVLIFILFSKLTDRREKYEIMALACYLGFCFCGCIFFVFLEEIF